MSPRLAANGAVIIDDPLHSVRDCVPPMQDPRDSLARWHVYCTRIPTQWGTRGYRGHVGHWHTNTSRPEGPWYFGSEVVEPGAAGAWDSVGVFTPGAIFDATAGDGGEWVLFYGGVGRRYVNHSGSLFTEWQGRAMSASPFGPFRKDPANPLIRGYGPPTLEGAAVARAGAAPPPPPPTCAASGPALANTNIKGGDYVHFPVPDSQKEQGPTLCAAACAKDCTTGGSCVAWTYTSDQGARGALGYAGGGAATATPNSTACPRGSGCCYLKSSASGGHMAKPLCTSGAVALSYPPGYWDWIRADNPRPLVIGGQAKYMFKGTAQNFTALLNLFTPAGSPSGGLWAGPYAAFVNNPVTRTNAQLFPEGFENNEFFMGPDGLLHNIGQSHGGSPKGFDNPHLVDVSGNGTAWRFVEMHPSYGEPAPMLPGIPGDKSGVPPRFIRFQDTGSKGRLRVWLFNITWVDTNVTVPVPAPEPLGARAEQ